MTTTNQPTPLGIAAKAGAATMALWAVLHLWVGAEGIRQFVTGDARSLWNMLIGGSNAPRDAFVHTTDALTANAQAHLILNFCIDVGGYGVLALVAAWMIGARRSWVGYFLFLVVVGICDLGFTFAMVTSGIITLDAGTIGGPVLWVIACAITPFGLPREDS